MVLKEIPKSYLPVERGEVPRKVRRLIVKHWERSAIIAWDERPRDVRAELDKERDILARTGTSNDIFHRKDGKHNNKSRVIIPSDQAQSTWGPISHAGWSSPASNDLPNLYYPTVVAELPNLIEAKAVSLAPPDPAYLDAQELAEHLDNADIPRDTRVASLLARPPNMGLRDYMAQLADFDLINPPDLAETFLRQYEYARFSPVPLTETQFRDLMAVFAAVLAGMTRLDVVAVEGALDGDDDGDDDASSVSTTRPRSASLRSEASSVLHHSRSRGTLSSIPSELRLKFSPSGSPLARRSRMGLSSHHRASSFGTLLTARSRASRTNTLYHTASNTSLRSNDTVERHSIAVEDEEEEPISSSTSSSSRTSSSRFSSIRSAANSVIHLTPGPEMQGQLPYQINLPGD